MNFSVFARVQNDPSLRRQWVLIHPGGIVEGTLCPSRTTALMLSGDRRANGQAFDLERPLQAGEACRRFQSLYLGA